MARNQNQPTDQDQPQEQPPVTAETQVQADQQSQADMQAEIVRLRAELQSRVEQERMQAAPARVTYFVNGREVDPNGKPVIRAES